MNIKVKLSIIFLAALSMAIGLIIRSTAIAEEDEQILVRTHFDPEKQRPSDLIAQLKDQKNGDVMIPSVVTDWITAGDVIKLVQLLEDETQCASIRLRSSSHLDFKSSRVKAEAAYLIISYFEGKFPHTLHSKKWNGGGLLKAKKLLSKSFEIGKKNLKKASLK